MLIRLIQARLGKDVWGLVQALWEEIWLLQERTNLIADIHYYGTWASYYQRMAQYVMYRGCSHRADQLTDDLFALAEVPSARSVQKKKRTCTLSDIDRANFLKWDMQRVPYVGYDPGYVRWCTIKILRSDRRLPEF